MKNPNEVLRMKEQEILRIKIEIEALRVTARLLSDENSAGAGCAAGPAGPAATGRNALGALRLPRDRSHRWIEGGACPGAARSHPAAAPSFPGVSSSAPARPERVQSTH